MPRVFIESSAPLDNSALWHIDREAALPSLALVPPPSGFPAASCRALRVASLASKEPVRARAGSCAPMTPSSFTITTYTWRSPSPVSD